MTERPKMDPAVIGGVVLGFLALAVLGPLVFPRLARLADRSQASRQVVFTIPPGTADVIKAGGDPKIVPAEMVFTLGVQDVLVIHNHDVTGHTFGPYWVASNNTLTVEFSQPAVFEGYCSVHPSNAVKIVVRSKQAP